MLVLNQQPLVIAPSFGKNGEVVPWISNTAKSGSTYYKLSLEYDAKSKEGGTFPATLSCVIFDGIQLAGGYSSLNDVAIGDSVGAVMDVSAGWNAKLKQEKFSVVIKYLQLVKKGNTNNSKVFVRYMEKAQSQPRVGVTSYNVPQYGGMPTPAQISQQVPQVPAPQMGFGITMPQPAPANTQQMSMDMGQQFTFPMS